MAEKTLDSYMKNILGFGVQGLEIALRMLMKPGELSTVVLVRVELGEAIEGCSQLEDNRHSNADEVKTTNELPRWAERNWVEQRKAMSSNWEPWQRNQLEQHHAVPERVRWNFDVSYRCHWVFYSHNRCDIDRSNSYSHQYLGTYAVTSTCIRNHTLAEESK